MKKIAIVYFSQTNVSAELANAISEGAITEESIEVFKYRITGKEIIEGRFINNKLIKDLSTCAGIIFGSPTYMGGPAAQFKAFADATSDLWCKQGWANKIAAGFTCGSAMNGDQSSTLHYFATLASQHGMLWVGLDTTCGLNNQGINRFGCQLGVTAHSPDGQTHNSDLATARYLGIRVRKIVNSLSV